MGASFHYEAMFKPMNSLLKCIHYDRKVSVRVYLCYRGVMIVLFISTIFHREILRISDCVIYVFFVHE